MYKMKNIDGEKWPEEILAERWDGVQKIYKKKKMDEGGKNGQGVNIDRKVKLVYKQWKNGWGGKVSRGIIGYWPEGGVQMIRSLTDWSTKLT